MNKIATLCAIIALTTPTQASEHEFSVIKPLFGGHFKERDNGNDWNNNYLDSIGFGYKYKPTALGVSATYVGNNSVGNNAIYIHGEYMPKVYEKEGLELFTGFGLGIRNGYPKKALKRDESDFILSGSLNIEPCYENHCLMLQVVPAANGVAILNYKFKF